VLGKRKSAAKEGKYALNWARFSYHDFVDNQVHLHLFAREMPVLLTF
jgi:hypothetical protein